jgi:hypothetical protein
MANNISTYIALGIVLLTLFYFYLLIVSKLKLRRLIKKYNENDDKSKAGEERRRSLGRIETEEQVARIREAEFRNAKTECDSSRLSESEGRTVFQTANVIPSGTPSTGIRKIDRIGRRIFKRLPRY